MSDNKRNVKRGNRNNRIGTRVPNLSYYYIFSLKNGNSYQ